MTDLTQFTDEELKVLTDYASVAWRILSESPFADDAYRDVLPAAKAALEDAGYEAGDQYGVCEASRLIDDLNR